MRIIRNTSMDPYFNLAAEEYLLETSRGDVFMLWQNSPAVIIGKNQNTWAEVNTSFTEANGIAVVRRLTGGGAVFHDPGNVNFTFITDKGTDEGINFGVFIRPITRALAGLGIAAAADGRNDIVSGDFKISGNAQCRYRRKDGTGRILHHGTLLYDAGLGALAGALGVNEEKLRSKGIKSVTSRVKNIRDIGALTLTTEELVAYLTDYAVREYGSAAEGLSPDESEAVRELAESKYRTWEWNYGKSPECSITKTKRFVWGTATAGYTLERGAFAEVVLNGDFFGTGDTAPITDALTGVRCEREAVTEALASVQIDKIIAGATAEDVAALLTE